MRTKKTVGNKTTNFTLVGGKVVSDGAYNYFFGLELVTNGSVYYLYNAHGDVIQLLNSNGEVTKTYDYDAYGNELTRDLNDSNPFRYCGEYYDTETGFIYLRARYYNPSTGRFISQDTHWNVKNMIYGDKAGNEDPKSDITNIPQDYNADKDNSCKDKENQRPDISAILQSTNLYAYCMNNPLNHFDENGKWSLPNWAKIAIGIAAITVGVIATVATGGAAAPVLAASLKMAAVSAAIGAASGAAIGVVTHRISTGSWEGVGKAALKGAIDGACDGFMWGGITAGASFTSAAAKGIKVKEIGRLKPTNKSGDGYPGVKYQIKKANGNYTTKSIELHSPHNSGPHNVWHWQNNTWSEYNNISSITGKAKHWTIWGKQI